MNDDSYHMSICSDIGIGISMVCQSTFTYESPQQSMFNLHFTDAL